MLVAALPWVFVFLLAVGRELVPGRLLVIPFDIIGVVVEKGFAAAALLVTALDVVVVVLKLVTACVEVVVVVLVVLVINTVV
jgi:hypothetical protein